MSRDPNPFRFEEVDATTQRVPSSPIQPWAAFVVSLLSMIACGIVNTIVSLPIAVAVTALFKEQLEVISKPDC